VHFGVPSLCAVEHPASHELREGRDSQLRFARLGSHSQAHKQLTATMQRSITYFANAGCTKAFC
jgi:hypothetical protein